MQHFYYSLKAFDVLERLDPGPEYWEGKRGASAGLLKQIVYGKESKDALRMLMAVLRNTSNPEVEYLIRIVKKYAKQIRFSL